MMMPITAAYHEQRSDVLASRRLFSAFATDVPAAGCRDVLMPRNARVSLLTSSD